MSTKLFQKFNIKMLGQANMTIASWLRAIAASVSTVYYPAGIYLFKVNNGNRRRMCEICSKLTKRHQKDVSNVVVMSLLLTLNRFHTLCWCFHSWLWTSKCQLVKLVLLKRPYPRLIFLITLHRYFPTGLSGVIALPRWHSLVQSWQ